MKYCITHDEWIQNDRFYWTISDECFLVSCLPPELDMSDDWVDSLPVPDEDELILMDMSAEALEADFIGE